MQLGYRIRFCDGNSTSIALSNHSKNDNDSGNDSNDSDTSNNNLYRLYQILTMTTMILLIGMDQNVDYIMFFSGELAFCTPKITHSFRLGNIDKYQPVQPYGSRCTKLLSEFFFGYPLENGKSFGELETAGVCCHLFKILKA